MPVNVAKEVAALQRMTTKQLREKYAEVFGEATAASRGASARVGIAGVPACGACASLAQSVAVCNGVGIGYPEPPGRRVTRS